MTGRAPEILGNEAWPRGGTAHDERIADAVARHRSLLEELRGLGGRQRACAEAGDGEGLLALLTRRGGLIREISAHVAHVGALAAGSCGMEPSERALLDEEIASLDALAAVIADEDEQIQAVVRGARDQMAQELAGMANTRKAAAAYGRPRGGPSPRYQDGQG